MTYRIVLSIILISSTFHISAQNQYQEVKRKSLAEIFKLIEKENDVSFSYDNQRVNNYKISYKAGQYSLNEFLDLVFNQTSLKYEYVDDSHIVVLEESDLANTLCGYLLDAGNNEPMPYASIFNEVSKTAVETDERGYFELSVIQDSIHIVCSYLGYDNLIIKDVVLGKDCESYQISKKINYLDEVEVVEYLDDGILLSNDANAISIRPQQMNILAGNVEKDIMSSLQFLPGITSPTESLDGLHIRGGTPDQNLILWDDIPMYHVSHMFGAITGLNPFMVQDVDIYRNGVSSRYGGRVSGVIDIKSKSQKPEKFSGGIGFNMMQMHLEIDIPIKKFSSLFFSTRLSLTDGWNSPAFISNAEKVFQGSKVEANQFSEIENQVTFNDVTFRYLYDNDKNRFDISLIGSLNKLLYQTNVNTRAIALDDLEQDHAGTKFSWSRAWSESFATEVIFTDTRFTKDYGLSYSLKESNEDVPIHFKSTNDLRESNVRIGAKWDLASDKWLSFGYQYTQDSITFSIDRRNFEMQSKESELFENELFAAYGDYNMDLHDLLQLTIGLRYQYSTKLKNEYFEPRIRLTTSINESLKLKLSTGKNFQFISQLVNFDTNELGLENQIWIAANNNPIPVIEANQWTGGLIWMKDRWTIDFDAYVKELTGLTSFSDSFDPSINVPYSTGIARMSGLDFLIKRRFDSYKTWVSYSYAKANYEFVQLQQTSFPATFDQRHILQWVHMYNYNRWSFSLGLTAKSGLPYSEASGIRNNNVMYESLNDFRLSPYYRLDGSIVYRLKEQLNSKSYISLSFQNLWDQQNALSRRYLISRDENNENPELIAIDLLGLGFTPNLSANISF